MTIHLIPPCIPIPSSQSDDNIQSELCTLPSTMSKTELPQHAVDTLCSQLMSQMAQEAFLQKQMNDATEQDTEQLTSQYDRTHGEQQQLQKTLKQQVLGSKAAMCMQFKHVNQKISSELTGTLHVVLLLLQ